MKFLNCIFAVCALVGISGCASTQPSETSNVTRTQVAVENADREPAANDTDAESSGKTNQVHELKNELQILHGQIAKLDAMLAKRNLKDDDHYLTNAEKSELKQLKNELGPDSITVTEPDGSSRTYKYRRFEMEMREHYQTGASVLQSSRAHFTQQSNLLFEAFGKLTDKKPYIKAMEQMHRLTYMKVCQVRNLSADCTQSNIDSIQKEIDAFVAQHIAEKDQRIRVLDPHGVLRDIRKASIRFHMELGESIAELEAKP